MTLIDPTTPEGFFHMRIVPYKMRLLEEGRSLFPERPEHDRDSYFDAPMVPAEHDHIRCEATTLTGSCQVERLRSAWNAGGDAALINVAEDLEALRQNVIRNKPPEDDDGQVSDFVYPLF